MMMHQTLEGTPIAVDNTEWDAAMIRWRKAKLRETNEWEAYKAIPDGHPDRKLLGALCEQSGGAEVAAWKALIEVPAPHLEALRWKLEQVVIVDQDEDTSAAWAAPIVRKVIADFQRLLPEADNS